MHRKLSGKLPGEMKVIQPNQHLERQFMELEKYGLQPQEQLAVSLYLKSMNKTQASRDAGYGSASVFNKPQVKAVIAEQLSIRAERLRVGGDWILMELKRVYDRCMQIQEVKDVYGQPTGETHFDANNAIKALNLIGKHVDVKAFDVKEASVVQHDELIVRLQQGRQRMALQQPIQIEAESEVIPLNDIEAVESPSYTETELDDEPPVSFMHPPTQYTDVVFDAEENEFQKPEEKLEQLMKQWRIGKPAL